MRLFKSLLLMVGSFLALAGQDVAALRAEIVTHVVELVASPTASQNQLVVHGRVDTLAQGLREVDAGSTTVGVNGTLRARLTRDTADPYEILAFELLDSSFTHDGLNLFYDVPNTSRRITFSATGLQFSLQFNSQQLVAAGPQILTNSYQVVQNTGLAEVSITNRPSEQQNLTQQNVLSTYDATQPVGQTSFAVLPPAAGATESLVNLSLPLSHQQLRYTGVGLPVTLNYAGTLNLVGPLPNIARQVPEPGTLALVGGPLAWWLVARRRCRSA